MSTKQPTNIHPVNIPGFPRNSVIYISTNVIYEEECFIGLLKKDCSEISAKLTKESSIGILEYLFNDVAPGATFMGKIAGCVEVVFEEEKRKSLAIDIDDKYNTYLILILPEDYEKLSLKVEGTPEEA
jgi:hypothetical protein